MQKPKILYYLHTYFMDSALELLKELASVYEIHLMLELSPDSLKSTVINIEANAIQNDTGNLFDILDKDSREILRPFLNGMASVNYVYYPSKHLFSFSNTYVGFKVISFIKKHHINLIHFDTSSGRFMPVLPFVIHIKKIATVHDPLPHKGEESFKKTLIKYIYSYVIRNYIFYSNFSLSQFNKSSGKSFYKTYTVILKPYSYISQIKTTIQKGQKFILYFGRISPYKGIDFLVDAFSSILAQYPNLHLVIAGKGNDDVYSKHYLTTPFSNITFLNKYISVHDLANLIANAEFIVCPYREATQSGVLMTAFALNKTVLATNVGSFSEYIVNNENGFLVEPNVNAIKNGLVSMLSNNHYKKLEKGIFALQDRYPIDNTNVFSKLYVA